MTNVQIKEFWKKRYKSYWGMIAVTSIGLVVLIFGGITFTWQQNRTLQAEISQIQNRLNSWETWEPVYEQWRDRRNHLHEQQMERISQQNLDRDQLESITEMLSETITSNALKLLEMETSLHFPPDQMNHLEVRLTIEGALPDFRNLFIKLANFPYRLEWKTLTVKGTNQQPEYSLTLKFPLA
ncbi:MAG: hypothetical protein JJT75_13275 [Opitutales bacterium]|nr:hypothetical protein [Opitutales bacterium]MCH8539728.1 hypothetical protein [Opitutales bacterium]